MEYQLLQTNYTKDSNFNYTDYNTLVDSVSTIYEMGKSLYGKFDKVAMIKKSGFDSFPFASEFNAIEHNIKAINDNTVKLSEADIPTPTLWRENKSFPTYLDINRYGNCLNRLSRYIKPSYEIIPRLSFTLGNEVL